MTLDSDNKVYADIRSGSQDLCKFSLDFMPASIYYVGYSQNGTPLSFSISSVCLWQLATNTAAAYSEVRD